MITCCLTSTQRTSEPLTIPSSIQEMKIIGFLKKTQILFHISPYTCNYFNKKICCPLSHPVSFIVAKKSFAPQYQKSSFSISRSIRGCHIMSKTDRSESGQDLRKVCIPKKDMIRNTKILSLPPEPVKISVDVDMKIL